jgi:hypothetical protein
MAHPHPPHYPNPHAPQARKPLSTTDLVLTPLLSGLLLLGALIGFFFSLFAGMATDGCGGMPDRCDNGLIGAAYAIAWGGIGLAVIVTVTGVAVAAVKRRLMFIWPVVGLVIFVAGMLTGGFMLNAGVGG